MGETFDACHSSVIIIIVGERILKFHYLIIVPICISNYHTILYKYIQLFSASLKILRCEKMFQVDLEELLFNIDEEL